jgi:hypothetical protein
VLSRLWRVLTVEDPHYGDFADKRRLLGVPNGADVLSNAPFVLIGAWGLLLASTGSERMLFAGVLLTGFGSAYFHLTPLDANGTTNKATLFWDRLPIALGFAGVIGMVLGEHLLWPLALLGAATVLIWRYAGVFWPYAFFQLFGALGTFVVVLVCCPHRRWLIGGLLAYGAAKVAEDNDARIFRFTRQRLSGHTVKHLLAALGALLIAISLSYDSGATSSAATTRFDSDVT